MQTENGEIRCYRYTEALPVATFILRDARESAINLDAFQLPFRVLVE